MQKEKFPRKKNSGKVSLDRNFRETKFEIVEFVESNDETNKQTNKHTHIHF